jgi:protein TonB
VSDVLSDGGALPAGGDLRRWTASLVVVLAAHAAGGAGLLAWRAPVDSAAPSGAVMIDLTPLPEPAPTPPVETVAAPAPPERPAEPPLPEPPPPEPQPPNPQPPEPEPIPEPLPDLQPSPAPAPEVAVATPPPRSKPRPPERPQPVAKPAEPHPSVSAPAPPSAAAPTAPAPVPSAPSGAVRSWQGEVLAHLERHKRYPRAAQARRQQGVAHVRFVIDRQGRVLSRSLEKGSGVAALDEETLAMVERADPVPAPPPDMAQSRTELVVPVVYAIR